MGGCVVSKATVHPAAANDDDVVVTRPAASLAQGNSAESAEMKAKIATLEAAVSVAVSGKATSEEARAAVEAELTRVQGHLLLDRSLSSDMQLSILNAELQKLQPYGAPAATASTTAGTGRGASMQRPTTAARFEETAKAQASLIGKLEDDIKKLQAEIKLLRNKYERKIKKVRVSSAKKRTENALQVFELKDQLSTMKKEMKSLQLVLERKEKEVVASALKAKEAGEEVESLRGMSASGIKGQSSSAAGAGGSGVGGVGGVGGCSDDEEEEDAAGAAHGNLVVQLSMQIADLDGELEDANNTITQLRAAVAAAGLEDDGSGGGGSGGGSGGGREAAAAETGDCKEGGAAATSRWQSAA